MIQETIKKILHNQGYFFKDIEEFSLKEVGCKKKIYCFIFIQEDKPTILFYNKNKSRILKKDMEMLEELVAKISTCKKVNFIKKIYLFNAPMCSKSQHFAEELNWRLTSVSM